jgi:hypothetical protein
MAWMLTVRPKRTPGEMASNGSHEADYGRSFDGEFGDLCE